MLVVSSTVANAREPVEIRPSSSAHWRRAVWLIPVLLFLLSVCFTQPPFVGDSLDYVAQIVNIANHREPVAHLWEAGHILWRPLGYAIAPLCFKLVPDSLAWTPELKVYFGLALFNTVCGLLATLLVFDLGRRLAGSVRAVLILTLLFVWGDAVLAYSASATPYIPGLAAFIAGLWCQITREPFGKGAAIASAVLFSIAALFWLPYVIAIPAGCCAALLLGRRPAEARKAQWVWAAASAAVAGAVLFAGIALAAALAGVHSLSEGVQWLSAAGHGMRQSRQLLRAVTGCSRLFFDLGRDGVYFKRFLFHDPYHVVTAAGLIGYSLWKVALFYVFIASVFWMAWRSAGGRRSLVLLFLAGAPALLAAVAVFEPSSPERFLPVLPFLLVSIAAGWKGARATTTGRAALIAASAFALLLPLLNLHGFVASGSGYHDQAEAQLANWHANASPGDALFTVTMVEPLEELSLHPFDPLNRTGAVRPLWLLDAMHTDLPQWRSRFARLTESSWMGGHAVWVENAVLADRPADSLLWTEGDNQTVLWRDIPAFFRTLDFDRNAGPANGFLRIAHSDANQARLHALEAADR
jgi:hypothetical protein